MAETEPTASSGITNVGGIKLDAGHDMNISGDVVGRDKITVYQGTPRPEIPPPPEPAQPPEVPGFVGRDVELAYYADQLANEHISVITGMAGVGKTALAAVLARRTREHGEIFWHDFHKDESVTVLIWKLASFLAYHGQGDLWRTLHGAHQAGGQLPPPEVLFDYLFQMLPGHSYLLCLDDFQFVDDDPVLEYFTQEVRGVLAANKLSLIIISQRVPAFIEAGKFKPLPGLSLDDTRAFLAQHGVVADLAQVKQAIPFDTLTRLDRQSLSPAEIVANLHARTEGNALFLTLAVDRLAHASNVIQFFTHLVADRDIERFLLNEIDRHLSEDERAVMSAVAVLLGYPGTSETISAILEGCEIRRSLSDLVERSLLRATEEGFGRVYDMNMLVRAFYYDGLNRQQRQRLHHRAGEYYELEQPDMFRAALHFERASEYDRAAQLATSDVWSLINRGQTRATLHVLGRLLHAPLSIELRAKVSLTQGDLYALHQDDEPAHNSYQAALSMLDTLPATSEVCELKARACRGLGTLLEYESPQESLAWLKRGLELVADTGFLEEAVLHIRAGSVQLGLGDYADAQRETVRGLELLPAGPSHWRAAALDNLGILYWKQGDLQRGKESYLRALEIYQQIGDQWGAALVQQNLGIDLETVGEWEQAIDKYQQALELAQRLGATRLEMQFENSLGIINVKQGNDESARSHLLRCIELARQHALTEFLIAGQSSLSDLLVRLEEWEAAASALDDAEALALETSAKDQLPEIYRGRTLIALAKGQRQEAQAIAQKAIILCRNLGLGLDEGLSQRVLGQVLIASHKRKQAREAFARSLALTEADVYETARTQLEWGRALLATEPAQAMALLREANAAFARLGAQRDKQICGQLLDR